MNQLRQEENSLLDENLLKTTFAEAPFGYARCNIILDNLGKPVDFGFLEVNNAFERLTGLNENTLLDLQASELPQQDVFDTARWTQLFGEIVRSGRSEEFEQYSKRNRKWFRIQAYSPRAPFVIALLFDITEQKTSQLALQTKTEALGRRVRGMTLLLYMSKLMHKEADVSDILQEAAKLIPSVWKVPEDTSVRITYKGKVFCSKSFKRREVKLHCDIRVFEETAGTVEVFSSPEENPLEIDEEYEMLNSLTNLLASAIENTESRVALKNNEATLRQYMDSAPNGITVSDKTGKYLEVNEPACNLLGYSKEEMLGMTVHDVISPEIDADEFFTELIRSGSQEGTVTVQKKDRTQLPVVISCVRLPDGHYMGFFRDISERQKTEQEKELYYNAIQALSQPMVITDTEGKILELNKAFSDMYGYSKKEVMGQVPNILNPGKKVYQNLGYTEKEYKELFSNLWSSIKNPDKGTWEDVIVNRRKDGSLMWVRLLINTVINDKKEICNFIGVPIDISILREKEKLSKVQLYRTMADLAELRDNETGNHMRRVGIFSKLLAKSMDMPEKYCDDIEIFTPMHDIGKVGILDSILLAPRKLTNEEFEEMKKHTLLGHNIVKGNKELELVASITLHHHERYDGRGYPHGLSGENIPLSARITAIADVYDALRSKRPYKEEWPHEKAKAEIAKNAGSQFDPILVRNFLDLDQDFENAYQQLKD
ncbi:MAG: PAS domain S-box protein [Chitinispirillaceae bacterium]